MTKYLIDSTTLTGIANAIREQTGDINPIAVTNMAQEIESIEGGGSMNYSTTEHEVGTWIDGSTIYEKTVDMGALPNSTTKNVSAGISTNLGIIVSIVGFAYQSTANGIISIHLPYASTLSQVVDIWYEEQNDYLALNTNFNATAYSGFITVQYTKSSS